MWHVCLTSALINTNTKAMKGNMEGDSDSAEQSLLTWSKMSSSLFYPNSTLSLWTPDTNADVDSQMVSGCSTLPPWTCTLPAPPPPPPLMTCSPPAISKLWSLVSGCHLMRRVWGSDWRWLGEYQTLTFLCHQASQRPHLQQPVKVASTHMLTSRPPQRYTHTPVQIWLPGFSKHSFEDWLSLFSFYPFNGKKKPTCFFSSRMLAPRGVNGFPRSPLSQFEFPCFVLR